MLFQAAQPILRLPLSNSHRHSGESNLPAKAPHCVRSSSIMAAAVRLPFALYLRLLVCLVLGWSLTLAQASPLHHPQHILPRTQPLINNVTGQPQVFNPATQQPIPQAPASDGAGTGFSPPAVLWIVFCSLVGVPLALAGIRGWRFTTGAGVGLAAAVCCPSLSPTFRLPALIFIDFFTE